VRAHGGEVGLASELGRGTTVTVFLPASRLVAPHADNAAA
jgi:signal transduction histidine kinase